MLRRGFELGSVTNRSSADVLSDIRSLADNLATNASWGITTALAFGLAITGEQQLLRRQPGPASERKGAGWLLERLVQGGGSAHDGVLVFIYLPARFAVF